MPKDKDPRMVEAGRKGGRRNVELYGTERMRQIGAKGGRTTPGAARPRALPPDRCHRRQQGQAALSGRLMGERVVVDTAAAAVAVGVTPAAIRRWVHLRYLRPVDPPRRGVISRFYLDEVYRAQRERVAADRSGYYAARRKGGGTTGRVRTAESDSG